MKSKINVITAGPSAGKTSTLRALSTRGYRTLPEAARLLLDQRISEGDDPEEVRRESNFHEQVEREDRRIEEQIPDDEVVFLDRSLADNIAYRKHFGNPVPDDLRDECRNKYHTVFLLERIEFQDDEVRTEDEKEAQELHKKIRNVYRSLGYDVVEVPLMPVDQRVDLIEEEIVRTPPIF